MTVQGIGACMLLTMMRRERLEDLDTSWILHGPEEPPPDPAAELPVAWRYAAE